MGDHGDSVGGPEPLDLLEREGPGLVEVLRAHDDAEALADFAGRWFDDKRPGSRRLLLDYLDRPLDARGHEGLVKRLFKRAEAAGDDEVMARFLVLLDRSVRRIWGLRYFTVRREVATPAEAQALRDSWSQLGYSVGSFGKPPRVQVTGHQLVEMAMIPSRSAVPRGPKPDRPRATPRHARLFSVATRRYLRRRAWRYFRNLGKLDPARYVAAARQALTLYRDEDVATGLALLDNWGLLHILFHRSPALVARADGWTLAPGKTLADLDPAPIFAPAWDADPVSVAVLVGQARSSTVRRWAIRRVEADLARMGAALPPEDWFHLLGHADPEVVKLAARVLESAEGFEPARWLTILEAASPDALETVCALVGRHVRPDQVTREEAARLAGARPLPLARLGLDWLQAQRPEPGADDRRLLGLLDAGCEPLRPEILSWLRGLFASGTGPDPVLEFLDSRHADARAEGWNWFLAEPTVRDDPEVWRRLLESPDDDVRLPLVAELEARALAVGPGDPSRALTPEGLRGLWAAVLLNVERGSRAKPVVIRQLLRRLAARPDLAPALMPLLGVALRSVRGPERRAGLVAVVQLVERRAEVAPLVRSAFPELQWT